VQDEPLHTGLSEATQLAVSETLTHADDLLAAARLLLVRYPHLAFHFAVLALEEVGRSDLLVMVEIARVEQHEGSRGLERGLEDHVVKLFWALWGPSFGRELPSRAQIEEHRDLARNLHEKRKSGLYYDPEAPLPRDAITDDEAENVIDMAQARIGLARTHVWGPLTEERATDVRWLVEHTHDKEARRRVMNAASMEKLIALGDVPDWVSWLRGEAEKEERVARELAERELVRAIPTGAEGLEPKWRLKARIVSASHSIREGPLNWWNTRNEQIKLHAAGRERRELAVEITLPKRVALQNLWDVGMNFTTTLVLALNIGARGLFWWYIPQHVSRFYEEIRDLEQDAEVVAERVPTLRLDWGNLVLSQTELEHVVLCFGALVRLRSSAAAPALNHYRVAISLLAKSDIFLPFEVNVFQEFYLALKEAMRAFGGWDGVTPYTEALDTYMREYETYAEDRERYLGLAERIESGAMADVRANLEDAGKMKLLTDGYFIQQFGEMRRAWISGKGGAEARPAEPESNT
jgi:AbiV family abortive infection protein